MSNLYPKIRALEAFPLKDDLICLRDPQGFSDKMLVLSRAVFYLCTMFDGHHTIEQIQNEYGQAFGDVALSVDLEKIIQKLDEAYFLENDRYETKQREIVDNFLASADRPASHAGGAYESEESALLSQLDAFLVKDSSGKAESTSDDDGSIAQKGTGAPGTEEHSDAQKKLEAIIAPHIDIRRGGPSFGHSYRELCLNNAASIFVILGIAHMPTKQHFALTRKNFTTPLGSLPVNQRFMDTLISSLSTDFFEDEFVHKQEHSIEFQVVFLQYLQKRGLLPADDISIVPILCSGFHDLMTVKEHISPTDVGETAEFIEALGRTIQLYSDEVCLIAGVDLSHVGRRFGQDVTLSPQFAEWVEQEDRRMLEPVMAGDAESFWRFIREEQDKRNVCGVSAIYTLLKLLENRPKATSMKLAGTLLNYDKAVEEQSQSIVSFFSGAFYSSTQEKP